MDSGCGDGYASRAFVTHGAALVFAYDVMLDINDKYLHPRIKLYDSLKVMHEICDIVWTHHVIEHVDNPIEYLRQLRNRLNTDGELWLACPNTANNSVFAKGHIHNFTVANIVLCLQKAGYCVEDMSWLINDGQLRIRVPKVGVSPHLLPKPFEKLLKRDQHFNVDKLPKEWNWK